MIISLEKLSKLPLKTWASSHRSCASQLQQFAVLGFVEAEKTPEAFRGPLLEIHAGYPEIEATADEIAAWEEAKKAAEANKKLEADKAFVLKHANEAGERYRNYWVRERNLLDMESTRNAIYEEVEKQNKRNGSIPSAALLDTVIEFLNTQGVLQWRAADPPLPPPPPPAPKIAGTGEDELDINESREWVLRKASDVQLRDLARRQARRARPDIFHFPPMPETITRKMIVNASLPQIDAWKRLYGNDAIDARLQSRG